MTIWGLPISHNLIPLLRSSNLLHIIQDLLDILRALQICLEDGWRGGSREALPDGETARVLEGVEDLPAQQARSAGDKDNGRHGANGELEEEETSRSKSLLHRGA